ncbi:MAG: RnfABCDGE type electron transport complex subunit G [Eubacteriales bacterium]|jgi:electron transport complex protein RnfG
MKAENNSMGRLGGILFAITLIAALLLGAVNAVTAPIIEQVEAEKQNAALQAIFPDGVDFPAIEVAAEEALPNGDDAQVTAAFQAKDASGNVVGVAVQVAPKGFGGAISMMVGINADGTVAKAQVLSMSETPGLGVKAKEAKFIDQYNGKSGTIAVDKDGGEIVAITGATITSRAVTRGVNAAAAFAANHMG